MSMLTRISAWEKLAKHLGMFIERKVIGIKRLEDMDDEELRHLAGQFAEQIEGAEMDRGRLN